MNDDNAFFNYYYIYYLFMLTIGRRIFQTYSLHTKLKI